MNSTLTASVFGPNAASDDERVVEWMATRDYTRTQVTNFRQAWDRGYFDTSQDAEGSLKPFYAFQAFSMMNDWPVLLAEPRQKNARILIDLGVHTPLSWKLESHIVKRVADAIQQSSGWVGTSYGVRSITVRRAPIASIVSTMNAIRPLLVESWNQSHPTTGTTP